MVVVLIPLVGGEGGGWGEGVRSTEEDVLKACERACVSEAGEAAGAGGGDGQLDFHPPPHRRHVHTTGGTSRAEEDDGWLLFGGGRDVLMREKAPE